MTNVAKKLTRIEVSILTVSWNSSKTIVKCLESIARTCANLTYEIIVVDNDSSDDTADLIASQYPHVQLIRHHSNVGFGSGNNIAARQASGKYLFLLNPDTYIEPDSLQTLLKLAELNPKAGVIAPMLVSSDGSLQSSVHRRYPGFVSHLIQYNFSVFTIIQRCRPGFDWTLYSKTAHQNTLKAKHVMGAAMLMPRLLFEQLGGFDERFFLYFEETDLCRRCYDAGREIIYTPEAKINHALGGSSGEGAFGQASPHYLRSAYQYFGKTHGRVYMFMLFILTLLELLLNESAIGLYLWSRQVGLGNKRGDMAKLGAQFSRRSRRWHVANWRNL